MSERSAKEVAGPASSSARSDDAEHKLEECIKLLQGSTDEERFAGLLMVTTHIPPLPAPGTGHDGPDAPAAALRLRIFNAIGATFLKRLLKDGSNQGSSGEGDAMLGLALNLIATFTGDRSIAPKFRGAVPVFLRVLRTSSDVQTLDDTLACLSGVIEAGCIPAIVDRVPFTKLITSVAAAVRSLLPQFTRQLAAHRESIAAWRIAAAEQRKKQDEADAGEDSNSDVGAEAAAAGGAEERKGTEDSAGGEGLGEEPSDSAEGASREGASDASEVPPAPVEAETLARLRLVTVAALGILRNVVGLHSDAAASLESDTAALLVDALNTSDLDVARASLEVLAVWQSATQSASSPATAAEATPGWLASCRIGLQRVLSSRHLGEEDRDLTLSVVEMLLRRYGSTWALDMDAESRDSVPDKDAARAHSSRVLGKGRFVSLVLQLCSIEMKLLVDDMETLLVEHSSQGGVVGRGDKASDAEESYRHATAAGAPVPNPAGRFPPREPSRSVAPLSRAKRELLVAERVGRISRMLSVCCGIVEVSLGFFAQDVEEFTTAQRELVWPSMPADALLLCRGAIEGAVGLAFAFLEVVCASPLAPILCGDEAAIKRAAASRDEEERSVIARARRAYPLVLACIRVTGSFLAHDHESSEESVRVVLPFVFSLRTVGAVGVAEHPCCFWLVGLLERSVEPSVRSELTSSGAVWELCRWLKLVYSFLSPSRTVLVDDVSDVHAVMSLATSAVGVLLNLVCLDAVASGTGTVEFVKSRKLLDQCSLLAELAILTDSTEFTSGLVPSGVSRVHAHSLLSSARSIAAHSSVLLLLIARSTEPEALFGGSEDAAGAAAKFGKASIVCLTRGEGPSDAEEDELWTIAISAAASCAARYTSLRTALKRKKDELVARARDVSPGDDIPALGHLLSIIDSTD